MINSLRSPRRAGPIITAALLLSALLLPACSTEPQTPVVTVEGAWIRLPAAPGQPAAGYFTAKANKAGEEILAVSSPAGKVEMHETTTEGTMSMMRPLSAAAFTGTEEMRFQPGGKHLMLFGLDPALRPGGKIALSFRFKAAPPVTVDAELKALGDTGTEHATH